MLENNYFPRLQRWWLSVETAPASYRGISSPWARNPCVARGGLFSNVVKVSKPLHTWKVFWEASRDYSYGFQGISVLIVITAPVSWVFDQGHNYGKPFPSENFGKFDEISAIGVFFELDLSLFEWQERSLFMIQESGNGALECTMCGVSRAGPLRPGNHQ